jgi:hypothetical protein
LNFIIFACIQKGIPSGMQALEYLPILRAGISGARFLCTPGVNHQDARQILAIGLL